ncbi:hypothetical protein B0I37DRAFT_409363 [Chaetomium sp. MPI-CAGE-AT-0009]|nr:hypothetical protein B0I37DRAFT_409363 [Chaetomium sp. MPI-CAGE-AT-0009]
MVFGWRSSANENEKMMQLFEGFSEFAELNLTSLAALVDFFPWKEKALYLGLRLKANETELFSDDQDSYITSTLLGAWSNTTSSTLYAFVQAIALYPNIQKKAQQEIDRAVGSNLIPTMDEEPNLE